MMRKQIKIFLLLLCVLAIIVAVPSCTKNKGDPDTTTTQGSDTTTTPPDSDKLILILNETDVVIGIGETKKLSATSSLTGMETSGVLWTSDNTSVATVDTSGVVKGVSDGTAVITAKSIDGSAEAKCAVTVTSKVSGVNIVEDSIKIELGGTKDLQYNIIPANASNQNVTWRVKDGGEGVVTVSQNGIIETVGAGTTTVYVTTEEGPYFDSCEVTVVISVKSITITQTDFYVNKGVDIKIPYEIFPANATETEVTFESNDLSVAKVLSNGKIYGVGAGHARITVKTSNGCSSSCIVNVNSPANGITISQKELKLKRGKDATLTAQVLPLDASIKGVTWSSSDSSVATVSQSGLVTAIRSSNKEVIITVRSIDGGYTAECKVWVSNPLSSITFDKTTLNLSMFDKPATITPTFYPADADNISMVTWTSNNVKVATVDANGVVTPVGPGEAEITLSTSDGVSATCTVVVPELSKTPVSSITIKTRYVMLKAGEKHRPVVTLLPEEAYDKTYILESSDSSIVRVEADGSLTAISKGRATITVISVQNPDVKEDFLVQVAELTQQDIDAAIIKYNAAIEGENTRHTAALANIESSYSYLVDLKAMLESSYPGFNENVYITQKAEIEKNIADHTLALTEAEAAGNLELVTMYTDLIAQEQEKLNALESKWENYSDAVQIYNEDNAKYLSEIAAETKLNADNIAKINNDYAYVLPYLPTGGNGADNNTPENNIPENNIPQNNPPSQPA